MKKINLALIIITILMTFMYINSREKISALGVSIDDYTDCRTSGSGSYV